MQLAERAHVGGVVNLNAVVDRKTRDGHHAPVQKTIQKSPFHFQGGCPNNSARWPRRMTDTTSDTNTRGMPSFGLGTRCSIAGALNHRFVQSLSRSASLVRLNTLQLKPFDCGQLQLALVLSIVSVPLTLQHRKSLPPSPQSNCIQYIAAVLGAGGSV